MPDRDGRRWYRFTMPSIRADRPMRTLLRTACAFVAILLVACGSPASVDAAEPHAEQRFEVRHAAARLAPADISEYAFFASSVAMSGETLVVGAWGEADVGTNTGAAYVFAGGEPGLELTSRLMASDAAAGARFGHSVAVSEDTILVGALYDAELGFRSGGVYVFEREGTTWRETAKLLPDDGGDETHFGSSVALDGSTALIGASGPSARSAYVFQRESEGWRQVVRFAPSTERPMRFGISVGVFDDVAVVGSPTADVESEDSAQWPGAAYVYERVGSAWTEVEQLLPGDGTISPRFGWSVAVSGDEIAVGAPGLEERAYIYRRAANGWILQSELASDAGGGEHFGVSVAIDGETLIVGAPGSDGGSGATYVFEQGDAGWHGRMRLVAPAPTEAVHLGGAVTLAGDVVVSGATGDEHGGLASGAAYVHSLVQRP